MYWFNSLVNFNNLIFLQYKLKEDNMIITIIGIVLGGFISWIITREYYKKSNQCAPDWALPLIEKLPKVVPTDEEFLKLFQDEITNGKITPHPLFSIVACPECGAPLKELEKWENSDEYNTLVQIQCPHCGWHDSFNC